MEKKTQYINGKIYSVRSPNSDLFFIGSTTQALSKRMTLHRYKFIHKPDYCGDVKHILCSGDAYIELFELFPCNTKAELDKREGEIIRENKNKCVNKAIITAKVPLEGYLNGKVYTIRSPNTDKIYIGSTILPLARRMALHNSAYKFKKQESNYTSFEIIDFGDAYIELLELYPCDTKIELEKREGKLQRQYKEVCVNKNIAGRNSQEHNKQYYIDHKEKIQEYQLINKDKIKKQKQEYQLINKDKIKKQKQEYHIKKKEVVK
jgi:hypothetical protein